MYTSPRIVPAIRTSRRDGFEYNFVTQALTGMVKGSETIASETTRTCSVACSQYRPCSRSIDQIPIRKPVEIQVDIMFFPFIREYREKGIDFSCFKIVLVVVVTSFAWVHSNGVLG